MSIVLRPVLSTPTYIDHSVSVLVVTSGSQMATEEVITVPHHGCRSIAYEALWQMRHRQDWLFSLCEPVLASLHTHADIGQEGDDVSSELVDWLTVRWVSENHDWRSLFMQHGTTPAVISSVISDMDIMNGEPAITRRWDRATSLGA